MGALACPVEDVTMRLAAPVTWAASSLVAPPESLGASPVYNPGCDSAETGMRGTLFWTLPGACVPAIRMCQCCFGCLSPVQRVDGVCRTMACSEGMRKKSRLKL